ncbi:MAG: tripartite tricarboxylate transporter substrate binding protein [Proteobacteria bacterium]|nr:tripartite tricarboxylate transporter substrate binding protein [Pseudomonadota bacterium]
MTLDIDRRRLLAGATVALGAAALHRPAAAQAYPSKPIKFIVPYAPGGNVDVTVRLIAEPMQRFLGQSVIVENRPGAGGMVGQEAALNAPADGYTVVQGAFGSLFVAPFMAGRPSMLSQFAPVSMLSTVPMVIVVPENSRFKTWAELVAAAKAKPGGVSLGHAGNGTPNHTDILRIQMYDNVTFAIVPYRGSGLGLNDVIAGQIDGYVDQLTSSMPYIKSGKVRPLVVIANQRLRDLPDVPILSQAGGSKDFDGGTTIGVLVRVETPQPIIDKLNAAIVAALKEPAVFNRLTELGAVVRPSTPAEFAAVMKADEESIGDLAKKGLLKSD